MTEHQPVRKTIRLKPAPAGAAASIADATGLGDVASRVLAARGFVADDRLRLFMNPTLREGLLPPDRLSGLGDACDVLAAAVAAGDRVAVCGDFDVDGLSGTAQMTDFLRRSGAEVDVHVPDRFADGYGLNRGMIDRAAAAGCRVLVSIDFGTKNAAELAHARGRGLRTVVIDHHVISGEGPGADAIVNPHRPDCGFAGRTMSAAGLVWYVLAGLRSRLPGGSAPDPREYLDLACLGTICDMVPLTGVNRVLAKKGLEALAATTRPGLRALKDVSGVRETVKCHDVSFGIGPRLNAAGRMVHGDVVVKLLTTKDSSEASTLAKRLNALNAERQDEEQAVRRGALKLLAEMPRLPPGLVVWSEDFHTGVVGIVAQRLVEAFHRPTVVLGRSNDGGWKGSVRSVKGFDVTRALEATSALLERFGGHEAAAGVSVSDDNITRFAEAFAEECRSGVPESSRLPVVEADAEVTLSDLSGELVDQLGAFAPFGVGNPTPVLLARGVRVGTVDVLKGVHTKVSLTDGRCSTTALLWRQVGHPALVPGAEIDVAFKVDRTTFRGVTSVGANVVAAVGHESSQVGPAR